MVTKWLYLLPFISPSSADSNKNTPLYPGLKVQIIQVIPQVINEVVDLLDSIPVPCDLFLLVDALHECSQPTVGPLDYVVFSIVDL